MTPKEKAVDLYNKYEQLGKDFTKGVSMVEFAKQCALIAVDEILNETDCSYDWQLVKEEIEKL